jgi:hypothetical protein
MNVVTSNRHSHRFRLYTGIKLKDGRVQNKRSAGRAYLCEGENKYSLQVFTHDSSRYSLVPHRHRSDRYWILARERILAPHGNSEEIWHRIGVGYVDARAGYVELKFDLFPKPIFMSIWPDEENKHQAASQAPETKAA